MTTIENLMKKAIEKENNRKFYRFKDFSTPHIVFYPLMVLYWLYNIVWNKLSQTIYSCCKWNEKRAYRIITENIVRQSCRAHSTNGTIHYSWRRWGNWWFDKYHCKLKDRVFCKKFNNRLTEYLKDEYQIVGYTKELDDNDNSWYDFTFKKEV